MAHQIVWIGKSSGVKTHENQAWNFDDYEDALKGALRDATTFEVDGLVNVYICEV